LAESGSLPAGLRFTDNAGGTALIRGVPTTGSDGSYTVTVTAANTSGTAHETFTLRVTGQPANASAAATAALSGRSKAGTGRRRPVLVTAKNGSGAWPRTRFLPSGKRRLSVR
jgi:PKD repeat protein